MTKPPSPPTDADLLSRYMQAGDEAAFAAVSNGTGHFKRPDGSTFDYPLNKLSAADRKIAEDAAAK